MRISFPAVIALALAATRLNAAGFVFSDNFTVLTPPHPSQEAAEEYAREVLSRAEAYRKEIAQHWLGEELPPSMGYTTINVAFTDQDAGLVWVKDTPQRKSHMLYLSTSPEQALGSTLAHEIAHVVLATRYPHPNRLPAWIEEGIAGKYDDESRQSLGRNTIAFCARTGNWPPIEDVLKCRTIPSTRKDIYAVASSLTDFLLGRRGRKTLLEFGESASSKGYDAALQLHYGITSVAQLQTAWQEWAAASLAQTAGSPSPSSSTVAGSD